jgi:hypothetical protein
MICETQRGRFAAKKKMFEVPSVFPSMSRVKSAPPTWASRPHNSVVFDALLSVSSLLSRPKLSNSRPKMRKDPNRIIEIRHLQRRLCALASFASDVSVGS